MAERGLVLKIEKLVVRALPPLTFAVARGECLAIEGPSGAGKTLVLRAIADLDPIDGKVSLDGRSSQSMSGPEWRRRVRYVAAEPRWWASTAAAHFAELDKARTMLPALGLDAGALERPIEVLSTGERQRLALVRALLDDPEVLLLDEPTGALDAARRDLVDALVSQRLQRGTVVLLVSHDADQVARLAHARMQLAPPAPTTPALPTGGRPS